MTTIFVILLLLGYIGTGAFTFGYVRGVMRKDHPDDYDDSAGFETPLPLMAAIFCPVVLTALILSKMVVPLSHLGLSTQQRVLSNTRKRIEIQQKTRIELEEANKELEREFEMLEEEEHKKSKRRSRAR